MSRDPLSVRVYRVALRLYPRPFREAYGDDMVRLMRDQRRDEGAARVVARALVDLVMSVPIQHLEARMHRSPAPLPFVVAAIASISGVLVALLGGSSPATLVLGTAIAVVAGAVAVVAWRQWQPPRSSGRTTDEVAASWWKLVVAGPCLVALVITGAGIGIDAWYLAMVTVIAAVVCTVGGLVLGLARLVTRLRAHGTT